jgi:glutathione S-transferase
MWMLNELNLDYEHIPVNDHNGETRSSDFIQLNPNGKVPLLIDGDYRIFESIAINIHLARKYPNSLWLENIDLEGQIIQWSIWAMMEIDENIMHVLSSHNEKEQQKQFSNLLSSARVIDDFLSQKPYLVGDQFTAADLNAAACFSGGAFLRYDFAEFKHLNRWLKECYLRSGAGVKGSSLLRFRELLN